MKAKDVMTSPVISVGPDDAVSQAARIMLQRHISGLPVIDQKGGLVGIVTEGDFLRRAETGTQRRRPRWLEYLIGPGRLADEYTRAHGRKVSEIMTADPLTVSEDTPLDEIVRLMEKRQIKRLPVVRDQQVVGILWVHLHVDHTGLVVDIQNLLPGRATIGCLVQAAVFTGTPQAS